MVKKLYQNIYVYLIVLLLVADFVTKMIVRLTDLQLNYYPSTIVKALLICFTLFFFLKLGDKKAWTYVVAILVIFLLGLVFDPERQLSLGYINGKFYYFIRHLYFFLLIPILANLSQETWKKIIKILIIFAKVNAIFIVLGLLFDINVFKSYPYTNRFGFNGLLPIQGAGTFYYIFVISIVYYKGFTEYRNFKKINRSTLLDFIILVVAALLLGTKGAYLFLFLLLLADVFFRQERKRLVYFTVGSLTLLFVFFSEKIAINMLKLMDLSTTIYTDNGLITVLLSYRDLLFISAMEYIEINWNAINYLIGGTNFTILKVEIELVDIFLFFGVVGIIIYLFFVKSYLFSKKEAILNIILILIFFIGNFSGNFVSSISNTTFFAFSFLYLKNNFSFNK
ncbi:hypothetical protein [Kordia jejudonensis]|uniref:hypothetical protein n=1 Tax=Kordia jejudonensis TaxID=1348245 RepID=UPI0006294932|nr:hypothetical protein [Kordia jejudonensis]